MNAIATRALSTIMSVGIAVGLTLASPPAPAAAAAPLYSVSRYMSTVDTQTTYDLGCKLGTRDYNTAGTQNNVVILFFAQPAYVNGVYGTYIFGGTFKSTTAIGDAAKYFGIGYYACTLSDTSSTVRIVISTSNYGSQVTSGHGQAWASMANSVNQSLIDGGFSSQASADGGSDIEMGWSSAATAKAWVDGYDVTNQRFMFNTGDAAGCPQSGSSSSPGACNNGWTQQDVYYVSWQASPSVPLPQIYRNDSAQAKQWQQVKLYGFLRYSSAMHLQGSLTQWNACQEVGCDASIDNTPSQGWQQLYDQLNSDSRTAQSLTWSTDVSWNNDPNTDP